MPPFFKKIHFTISENLGNLYFLPIEDNVELNMAMKISLPSLSSNSAAYITRCEIAWSHGCSISSSSRNNHTVYQSSYTVVQFHQQCTRVLISSYPHQHLLFSGFFILVVILISVGWYFIVGFYLHFCNKLCWASFHVLVGHIFCGKMSILIFYSALIRLSFCWVVVGIAIHSSILPGKPQGQGLAGYSLWGCKEETQLID